eukprot:2504965-Karenia_brevis.AAC.1
MRGGYESHGGWPSSAPYGSRSNGYGSYDGWRGDYGSRSFGRNRTSYTGRGGYDSKRTSGAWEKYRGSRSDEGSDLGGSSVIF